MTDYSDRAIAVAKKMQDLRDPAAPSDGGYHYDDAATAERVLAALAHVERAPTLASCTNCEAETFACTACGAQVDPYGAAPAAPMEPSGQPAAGAPRNWPHGYLACGCRDNGEGRHVT